MLTWHLFGGSNWISSLVDPKWRSAAPNRPKPPPAIPPSLASSYSGERDFAQECRFELQPHTSQHSIFRIQLHSKSPPA